MKILMEIGGQCWRVDHDCAQDIGIPLSFVRSDCTADSDCVSENRRQPVHFDAPPARAQPYRCEGFVGSLSAGGSCRVDALQLVPHCNGTHTETRLHIADDGPTMQTVLHRRGAFLEPCTVISVDAVPAEQTEDHYLPPLVPDDQVITRNAIQSAIENAVQCALPSGKVDETGRLTEAFLRALVIRTRPNLPTKKTRHYRAKLSPPFLTLSAIEYLVACGVQHLLVDIPSVDRYHDEGKLSVHHVFFAQERQSATITELIYVPDAVQDGWYLLNLHCPSFDTDAVPSRPVLLPIASE